MSNREWFDHYAEKAKNSSDITTINGRYSVDRYNEHFIAEDVIRKMEIQKDDIVLDVGCGAGTLTFPISCRCKEIIGIDNPVIINRLINEGTVPSNCTLIEGNWLEYGGVLPDITKVVIYSVLHIMENLEEAFRFVDKALDTIKDDGCLLLGDVPNADKKRRFLKSSFGQRFDEEYKKDTRDKISNESNATPSGTLIELNDKTIAELMEHYQERNCDVYILPRADYLPFSYTRMDILIEKRSIAD